MGRDYVLNSRRGGRGRFKSREGKNDRHSTTLAAQWYESRMGFGKSDHFRLPQATRSQAPHSRHGPKNSDAKLKRERRDPCSFPRLPFGTHAFRASRHVQLITHHLHEAILRVSFILRLLRLMQ